MNLGDRVRILSGQGHGHEGVLVRFVGDSAMVRVATLKALTAAKVALIVVRQENLEVLPAKCEATSLPVLRPYQPEPFRVPRPGSEIASTLPSVLGGQLVYPRGLR